MSKQPLRIAIFHNLEAGGAKRALWHYAKLLHEHGHTLDLFTLSSAHEHFLPLAQFMENTVITQVRPFSLAVHARIPIISQLKNVVRRLWYLPEIDRAHHQIAQQINRREYDLAFVHICMFTHVPNLLQYLQIPSVFFCHEPSRKIHEPELALAPIENKCSGSPQKHPSLLAKAEGLCYAISEPLYKRTYHHNEVKNLRCVTRVLTNSYYAREIMYRTYGIFPNVNYLGIDAEYFKPMSEVPKEYLILSVGRLDPMKQHHIVIESVAQIHFSIRPKVVIVGEIHNPGYVAYLEKLATSLNVSIQLEIAVDEATLIRWYRRAQAVVFLPILEPFGLVSLEAMACETPIIGVQEGGIREVVLHEETGLLVDRNPQEIAEAIVRILQDKDFAETLKKKGREYVCTQWTWEKSFEQLMTHFDTVLR